MAIPHAVSKLTIASETVHVAPVLSAGVASRPHHDEHELESSSVLAITAAEETTAIVDLAEGPRVMARRADRALRVPDASTGARAWPVPGAPRATTDADGADDAEHLVASVWPGAARRPSAQHAWEMGEPS
jgi:hypothetical protein